MARRVIVPILLAAAAIDRGTVARAQAPSAASAASPSAASPSAASPAAVPVTDIPALRTALYDPQTRPDQRDQAAQRLLSRPDPAARQAVRDALVDVARPTAQLAAVRALAAAPVNDPTLVTPLFALLDGQAPTAQLEAAARALTAYKNDADVLNRLIALAVGGDERVRVVVLRFAVGTFPDQRAAAALVPLTDPLVQPASVTAAAGDALAYLAGFPTNAAGWQNWWSKNRAKSETQFQADLATSRAVRFDRSRADYLALQDEMSRMLADDYQRKSPDQQAETLLRYLKSADAGVRVIGCRIARQAGENYLTATAVKEQLRQLVGDASAEVRRRAAGALAVINDSGAVVPILTQLAQEPDSAARGALADAVRPTRDVRAAPLLLALLDDPSVDTARSAAEALTELGQNLRQTDPAAADRAAEKLRATLVARTTPGSEIDLRDALVHAMTPLRSRDLRRPLQTLLSSRAETPKVRRSLLDAIGELRDPQLSNDVVAMLGDPEDRIRVAAVIALGKTAESFGDVEKPLRALIDPAKEPNVEVRERAWAVLVGLFPKAPREQLGFWEGRLADDPVKLLVVLREERGREQAAGHAEQVALKDQQIGDYSRTAYLWADAITAYTSALAYFQPANKTPQIIACSDGLADAFLRNRQYDKAVDFVRAQIGTNASLQDTLGRTLKREAERLAYETKDKDAAIQLIDRSLKIPQLKRQFTDPLQQLRAEVQRQSKEQNLTPYPPFEQTQSA